MFQYFYGYERPVGVNAMLSRVNMTFIGREHSGIDDARNIARIVTKMANDGCYFKINDSFPRNK